MEREKSGCSGFLLAIVLSLMLWAGLMWIAISLVKGH